MRSSETMAGMTPNVTTRNSGSAKNPKLPALASDSQPLSTTAKVQTPKAKPVCDTYLWPLLPRQDLWDFSLAGSLSPAGPLLYNPQVSAGSLGVGSCGSGSPLPSNGVTGYNMDPGPQMGSFYLLSLPF